MGCKVTNFTVHTWWQKKTNDKKYINVAKCERTHTGTPSERNELTDRKGETKFTLGESEKEIASK